MKKLVLFLTLCLLLHSQPLKVFAMNPQLSVLLSILYPQGMIGLNYQPYPEDLKFMPKNLHNLPILGGYMGGGGTPSFEKIIALSPDIIFFSDTTPNHLIIPYQNLGIKTYKVHSQSLDEISQTITLYGEVLGIQERAKKLNEFISQTQQILSSLYPSIKSRPKVYFAQGYEGLQTQCSNPNDPLDLAYKIGGENIIICTNTNNPNQRLNINFETLLTLNPDIIFVRELQLFKQLTTNSTGSFKHLKAIRNHQVFYAPSTPSNWLMRPASIMQSIGFIWAFSKTQPSLLSEQQAQNIAQQFFELFLTPLSTKDYKIIQGISPTKEQQ